MISLSLKMRLRLAGLFFIAHTKPKEIASGAVDLGRARELLEG
jgi:hypothetical protein